MTNLGQHTCVSGIIFALELGETPPSSPYRLIDRSAMEGVEAGEGLLELRSGGVL